MATLRDIKRKLQSVKNIEKITQAMEMVAASHLRKAQAREQKSLPYYLKIKEILDNIVATADDLSHPLIVKREVKKTGFIVIAGDRGLCGGYNQAIFNATEKLLKKYPIEQVELFLVGRKAIEHFGWKEWKVLEEIPHWGGKITYSQIEEFTKKVIDYYLKGEVDEVWLIYTHFISVVTRKVAVEKFLNLDYLKTKELKPPVYIMEPDINEIFAEVLTRYCSTKMQAALNEAYISELAARIFSMRSATENAEERIQELTLVRNKIRQMSITRELIEITTGAESLK